ncbi:MAG: hypothetical protein MdMp014T_2876 [Treponematales bacterium]
MSATAVLTRKRLHRFIDELPETSLPAVEPLLSYMADEPLVIEPANAEERALIEEGMKRFREHPEDFISLDDYLAHGADYVPPEPEKQDWWPRQKAAGNGGE